MSKARNAVLITGASGGLGQAIVHHLRERDFHVFAGVRSREQLEAMKGENVTPLLLDVTEASHVDAALDAIQTAQEQNGWKFSGLINNAAREHIGALELLPLERVREEMDVGLFGSLALIQKFLPLLRQNRGRIVNISSIDGITAVQNAGSGCIAKRSVEAMSDVLRLELARWDIDVVLINPGPIATPLWDKTQEDFEEISRLAPPGQVDLYYPEWSKVLDRSRADTRKWHESAIRPEHVATAIHRALTLSKPKTRYVLGGGAKWIYWLKRLLPTRWMDSISAKNYDYSGDQRR